MTLKNNRAPLLRNIKLYASFHHHMSIQTRLTVRKRLSWVVTSVTLTFNLWPWPFAWTLLSSLVITPENFMMIRWWEHSQKDVTDRRTDGNTICRAAWPQLKMVDLSRVQVIYGRTQGHNCDTENKPLIGSMQALSSTDSNIFWLHKTCLSFWLWLEKYLVTMDPYFEQWSHPTLYLAYWHILHVTILI